MYKTVSLKVIEKTIKVRIQVMYDKWMHCTSEDVKRQWNGWIDQ